MHFWGGNSTLPSASCYITTLGVCIYSENTRLAMVYSIHLGLSVHVFPVTALPLLQKIHFVNLSNAQIFWPLYGGTLVPSQACRGICCVSAMRKFI